MLPWWTNTHNLRFQIADWKNFPNARKVIAVLHIWHNYFVQFPPWWEYFHRSINILTGVGIEKKYYVIFPPGWNISTLVKILCHMWILVEIFRWKCLYTGENSYTLVEIFIPRWEYLYPGGNIPVEIFSTRAGLNISTPVKILCHMRILVEIFRWKCLYTVENSHTLVEIFIPRCKYLYRDGNISTPVEIFSPGCQLNKKLCHMWDIVIITRFRYIFLVTLNKCQLSITPGTQPDFRHSATCCRDHLALNY